MGVSQLAFLPPHSHLRGLHLGCPAGRGSLWTTIPRAEWMREGRRRCPQGMTYPRTQSQQAAVSSAPLPPVPWVFCVCHVPFPSLNCSVRSPEDHEKEPSEDYVRTLFGYKCQHRARTPNPILPKPCPVRQPELVPTGSGCG